MKKSVFFFLAVCLFISLNVVGQQSLRYKFASRKVGNKKINVLKSDTDSLVVQPQEKVKPGTFKRSFTLGGQSYHWILGSSSTLYRGDTVLATATKTLNVNGKSYKIKQRGTSSYSYLTPDKKEVIRGVVSKEKGELMVNIVFLDNQLPDRATLEVASTYFGLTMIEARKRKPGVVLASVAGFALGYALGSAAAN